MFIGIENPRSADSEDASHDQDNDHDLDEGKTAIVAHGFMVARTIRLAINLAITLLRLYSKDLSHLQLRLRGDPNQAT